MPISSQASEKHGAQALAFELLLQLESRYGIQISLETLDFEDFRSVASIAAFVAREGTAGKAQRHVQ